MKVNFVDPGAIMGAVVALIILAVGVFAFFVTVDSIADTTEKPKAAEKVVQNVSDTYNSVLSIVGIVLIIGAIMTVIGLVYNFVGKNLSNEIINIDFNILASLTIKNPSSENEICKITNSTNGAKKEEWVKNVNNALNEIKLETVQKIVLSRKVDVELDKKAGKPNVFLGVGRVKALSVIALIFLFMMVSGMIFLKNGSFFFNFQVILPFLF